MQPKIDPPRGVLLGHVSRPEVWHERFHPGNDLAGVVEHYWNVAWDVPGPGKPVATLPHPSVHLVIERSQTVLSGVHNRRFDRTLKGAGFVFGVKFRPASFFGFFQKDLAQLTNREVDPCTVFGPSFAALEAGVFDASTPADRAGLADAYFRQRRPAPDPVAEQLNAVLDLIATEHSITQVEQLRPAFGRTARQIQRLFKRYVGVGPKWVIARYRIHEALAQVQAGRVVAWTPLANSLGYSDQAHFCRDFTRLVGVTPSMYARALREGPEGERGRELAGAQTKKPRRSGRGF